QLARVPALDEETIGRAYGHRSYFHGEPEDRREGEATVLPTWRGPRLSTVFATERSDRYALAISNPLRDETESTAGVIGVMLEVGAFAEIPGDDAAAGADRFAVLIDQRTQPPGLILHHPRLADLPGARRRALIEEHGEERLCAPAIPSGSLSHYADPLDRLASGSHRRWLASHRDVSLDGSLSGLGVVVQEDYETLIGSDVDDLSRRLGQVVWTAMAALFLLLAAFWFVLTRRLAR
ncbi:MAG: hypothetical protein KDB53_10120, partial [Planctomycetes bacterium]|nr:hypothetical protein [Planctomycetota bacterium]